MLAKKLLPLSFSLILASCEPPSSVDSENPPFNKNAPIVLEGMEMFEDYFLADAQSLADAAVLKFDPCEDDLQWVKTGPTSGTINLSGYEFETNQVLSLEQDGCNVNITPYNPNNAGRYRVNFSAVGSPLEINNEYAILLVVNGGSVHLTDTPYEVPQLNVSETGAHASMRLKGNVHETFSEREARYFSSEIERSTSLAFFSVSQLSGSINLDHENNVMGSIPSQGFRTQDGTGVKQRTLVLNEIQTQTLQGEKGLMAMAVFNTQITTGLKNLYMCYSLYKLAKSGQPEMWINSWAKYCPTR